MLRRTPAAWELYAMLIGFEFEVFKEEGRVSGLRRTPAARARSPRARARTAAARS